MKQEAGVLGLVVSNRWMVEHLLCWKKRLQTAFNSDVRSLVERNCSKSSDYLAHRAPICQIPIFQKSEDGVDQRLSEGCVIMLSIHNCHEIIRDVRMKRDKLKDPSYPDEPGRPQLGS